MVIYWGTRNLQFYSLIVALLSHFNAQSMIRVVKDVLHLQRWQWKKGHHLSVYCLLQFGLFADRITLWVLLAERRGNQESSKKSALAHDPRIS